MVEKAKLLFRLGLQFFIASPLSLYIGHRSNWGYDQKSFFGREGQEMFDQLVDIQHTWDALTLLFLLLSMVLFLLATVLWFTNVYKASNAKPPSS